MDKYQQDQKINHIEKLVLDKAKQSEVDSLKLDVQKLKDDLWVCTSALKVFESELNKAKEENKVLNKKLNYLAMDIGY